MPLLYVLCMLYMLVRIGGLQICAAIDHGYVDVEYRIILNLVKFPYRSCMIMHSLVCRCERACCHDIYPWHIPHLHDSRCMHGLILQLSVT